MIHNEYSLPSLGCWPYINGDVVFEYAGEFRMGNIDGESQMAADGTRVREHVIRESCIKNCYWVGNWEDDRDTEHLFTDKSQEMKLSKMKNLEDELFWYLPG